ncbi:sarcalumenin-like [Acanthaster planci]|uniref:Sarcalumenin n=1 Tax=Acanthaster planci TaxID=133434 RepID=A0A8B7Z1N9_ACAPL|nr:sarcalumenin-like [Acanthaster planci]
MAAHSMGRCFCFARTNERRGKHKSPNHGFICQPTSRPIIWVATLALLISSVSCKDAPQQKTPPSEASSSQEHTKPSPPSDKTATDKHGMTLPIDTISRSRDHIFDLLNLDRQGLLLDAKFVQDSIEKMKNIYHLSIEPMAEAYKFETMGHPALSDGELDAKPMVLFLGPWSAGKSTMINYLVGLEDEQRLPTGAEPTTADFTVVMHGSQYRSVEGLVLATDGKRSFGSLERFGNGFLERFYGMEYPHKMLEKVTLVDTPGIIENRKQQERGYPFNEVCEWFMDRADLIFVVFDPTKLDVGTELESTFKRLKGRESQIRIIMNKADTIAPNELMRVYGALFWNLAPLINVTEPPRVYVGSFWQKPFQLQTYKDLFLSEEKSLLIDLNNMIENQLHNKIATVRRRAKEIRTHAVTVNEYLKKFNRNKPIALMGNPEDTMRDIVQNPDKYNIFKTVLAHANISKYDLPDPEEFKTFFAINPIDSFQPLETQCSYFSGCLLDRIEQAISIDLPKLLESIQKESGLSGECSTQGGCIQSEKNMYSKP